MTGTGRAAASGAHPPRPSGRVLISYQLASRAHVARPALAAASRNVFIAESIRDTSARGRTGPAPTAPDAIRAASRSMLSLRTHAIHINLRLYKLQPSAYTKITQIETVFDSHHLTRLLGKSEPSAQRIGLVSERAPAAACALRRGIAVMRKSRGREQLRLIRCDDIIIWF